MAAGPLQEHIPPILTGPVTAEVALGVAVGVGVGVAVAITTVVVAAQGALMTLVLL